MGGLPNYASHERTSNTYLHHISSQKSLLHARGAWRILATWEHWSRKLKPQLLFTMHSKTCLQTMLVLPLVSMPTEST